MVYLPPTPNYYHQYIHSCWSSNNCNMDMNEHCINIYIVCSLSWCMVEVINCHGAGFILQEPIYSQCAYPNLVI